MCIRDVEAVTCYDSRLRPSAIELSNIGAQDKLYVGSLCSLIGNYIAEVV